MIWRWTTGTRRNDMTSMTSMDIRGGQWGRDRWRGGKWGRDRWRGSQCGHDRWRRDDQGLTLVHFWLDVSNFCGIRRAVGRFQWQKRLRLS